MISWTTARAVPFERIGSSSSSSSFSSATVITETFEEQSYSNATTAGWTTSTLTGSTTNQSGYTWSSTYLSSFSLSFSDSGSWTGSFLSSGTWFTTTDSSSQSGSYATQTTSSGSFSTQHSIGLQTSTIESFTYQKYTTASSTVEQYAWTTSTTETDVAEGTTTIFETTYTTSSNFGYSTLEGTSTREIATSTTGTTFGNVADTIYQAEDSEVLWSINENPNWSEALTDNAESGTRFTATARCTTATLIPLHSSNEETIEGVLSTENVTFSNQTAGAVTYTINEVPTLVGGSTQTIIVNATSSTQQTQERTLFDRQELVHYGNTITQAAFDSVFQTATHCDPEASASWEELQTILTTAQTTATIDNLVSTYSISEGGPTTSSEYGNTTYGEQFVGGQVNIAFAGGPFELVFSPIGVVVNGDRGLFFNGSGFPYPIGSTQYLPVVNYGGLTKLSTVNPAIPTDSTISENSITYTKTTTGDNGTQITTQSGTFGVDGEPWTTIARTNYGAVGGNLAYDETGLIRIGRGLWGDQDRQTSWFIGNDTTYTGTRESSHWKAVSFLFPVFAQSVHAVPRNTNNWPSVNFGP